MIIYPAARTHHVCIPIMTKPIIFLLSGFFPSRPVPPPLFLYRPPLPMLNRQCPFPEPNVVLPFPITSTAQPLDQAFSFPLTLPTATLPLARLLFAISWAAVVSHYTRQGTDAITRTVFDP